MNFNKRANAIKARAGGIPTSPRANVDVTLLAASFATKLKLRAAERKAEPSSATKRMDALLAKRGIPREKRHTYEEPVPVVTKAPTPRSARGELSWTAKRKEAYLRKYGREREEVVPSADVAVSAVAFVGRLKTRAMANDAAAKSNAPTQPASPGRNELSWTQKRKQMYLRKYGRQRETEVATPDVAVSAVVFGAKLKRLARETKAQAAEDPVALM